MRVHSPRRRGNNLPGTRKVRQKKPRNHVNGQVNEHGGVAVTRNSNSPVHWAVPPHGHLTLGAAP